jgi:hypothetical protein
VRRGLQQEVDAFLAAHHAHVADQVLAAPLEPLVGRHDLHALEARAAAHHEHALGGHPAALDGDAAVGLVGRDRHVGAAERQPLEPHHQLPQGAAAPELGFVELRARVVVVEDELLAEELVERPDEEEQIRRIAGMHYVEAPFPQHFQAEEEAEEHRRRVLDEVAQGSRALGRQRIAPDVDAVDDLVPGFVAAAGGADDRHLVAGGAKRERFLPHAPVKRAGQVLYEDQYAALRAQWDCLRSASSWSRRTR